jgi:site-specific DNA-methyltransferase (adenine-specific)
LSTRIYYKTENTVILQGDMLQDSAIHNNHIDLIITSPPYNLGKSYSETDDCLTDKEYEKFTYQWLQKCYELGKPDCRLCMNIPLDTNKGGNKSLGANITVIAQKVGWKYRTTIVWNEGNVSKKEARGSWLSARTPSVITPVELIVVMYKAQWSKINTGTSDITEEEFVEWTNGLWTFHGESKSKIGHPAPFPIELPKRCVKLFGYVEDVVLDPFMGSGSTLMAANLYNRKVIGIEISESYCGLAKRRIEKQV